MDAEQLDERVASFLNWTYRFEFDNGVATPVADTRRLNRQIQRRRYLFEPLLGLFGGTLSGQRVLDLGCGPGFWALQSIEAGADFVLGADRQKLRLDQARLVFEAAEVDPARFELLERDVFELEPKGFDVALCIALFEETCRPAELFELISSSGADVVLIESELSRAADSYFELAKLPPRKARGERSIALIPTREAIAELAGDFGYKTVALARTMSDYEGLEDYRTGRRLGFICARESALDTLDAEPARSHGLRAGLHRALGRG